MHNVVFTPNAEADLGRLNTRDVQRILKKLRWLAENFDAISPEALTGR